MFRTITGRIVFLALTLSLVGSARAAEAVDISTAALRTPDYSIRVVEGKEKATYDRALDSYRRAMLENPGDAALALSACRFSEHFGMSEELAWADAASKDFDACKAALEQHHMSDAEAALFSLEHRYGTVAIAFGAPLVARAAHWTVPQQARLHEALARAYAAQKNDASSGKEAVIAVRLDPASLQLVPAMRYLAKQGDTATAAKLLAAAPLPKYWWMETPRLRAAAEVLRGNDAQAELHRAQRAGLKVDPYTAARVLARIGDAAGADAILTAADKSERNRETAQDKQFRLDVAFDAADAKAAADIIGDQFASAKNAAQLMPAYAHLLRLNPWIVRRADLVPLALDLVVYLLMLAAAPGLLMFPVHYRGTVRQRIGKPTPPLFERIGLRHAWLAVAIFSLALYVVGMLSFGGNGSLSSTGGVARVGWQKQVAVTHMWAVLVCAAGLASVGRLLSWPEWIGSGRWKSSWFLVPAAPLALGVAQWLSHRHTGATYWTDSTWAVALVHGAQSLGGVPLALLIVSVLVPIMEELVFRGCLLGGLSRHLSFGWANFLQAIVFAAFHQDSKHFVFLFALGAIAGWLAKRTKGLAMPILLHALNNAIFVVSVTAG